MGQLGRCLIHTPEDGVYELVGCPGTFAYSTLNNHGTHFSCDCPCHLQEKVMTHSGPARAEARRVNPDDVAAGLFDEGAQLALTIEEAGEQMRVDLSYASAHAARDALAGILHEHASRSIVQRLEDELDKVMVSLMAFEPGWPGSPENDENSESKGRARGLAEAIALMRGSDLDTVRAEAMARYNERDEEEAL